MHPSDRSPPGLQDKRQANAKETGRAQLIVKLVAVDSSPTIFRFSKSVRMHRSRWLIRSATQQMDELVDRAATSLSQEDAELIRKIVDSYWYLSEVIADKKTSIQRLRKLMFGASTEKTKHVVGQDESWGDPDSPANVSDESSGESTPESDSSKPQPAKRPGHGRISADKYRGADQVEVKHDHLCEGDPCPECDGGKLYEKAPRVIVRIVGQPPLGAGHGVDIVLSRETFRNCTIVLTMAASI